MNYLTELCRLTPLFEHDYPSDQCPEIMSKEGRPYNCVSFKYRSYIICIPFRTNINHKHAYLFRNTRRSRNNKSGLDFSKMIIVIDKKYLSKEKVIVDRDEYREMIVNMPVIVKKAIKYLDAYTDAVIRGSHTKDKRFERTYHYSTLKYFHKELGL
ncbi:MAG: hypothetical protein MJ220_01560 [Bacilli bacterium]|nr:hypothetical protein [Bacilli bacterium]